MLPLIAVQVDAAYHEVRDVLPDGDRVWVATSGGVEAYDATGARVERRADLPVRDALTLGLQEGALVVGTSSGAFAWHDGWTALGPERPVVAVTAHHVVYRDGTAWPEGDLGQRVVDAVEVDGALVGFTHDGWMLAPSGARRLPGPVADVEVVGGEIRVACHLAGVVVRGDAFRVVPVLATAAGAVWGTVEGQLVSDAGEVVGQAPGPVTAVASYDGAVLAGTSDGLFAGGRRLTGGGPCGNFVTGITRWKDRLVLATFDHGACAREPDGSWTPLSGLPTPLVNDALAVGDTLWLATGEGLVRVDEDGTEVIGEEDPLKAWRPGVNHHAVNALSRGPHSLWIADTAGPVQATDLGVWLRYRWGVDGMSYQDVAACPGGEVWVASEDAGLSVHGVLFGRIEGASGWRQVSMLDGLPEDWVMAVACAGPGAAWVGTYRHGVGRFDAAGWHPVPGLDDAWVQALAVEGDTLWVGTADGLYAVQGEEVQRVSRSSVRSLLVEDAVVWVGTETGLEAVPRP